MEEKNAASKMVKYTDDLCYGKTFDCHRDSCFKCWIKRSCESNFKANVKKQKTLAKGKVNKVREKKYKKTAKYKEWF